jgi:DNA-binding Lrp family transcriptional regulator
MTTSHPISGGHVVIMTSIDRLDAEILGRLTVNARAGVAELAADLHVSRATVQLRLRRLVESGVLLGFQPIIDFSSIGMPVQALISIELDQRLLASIIRGLRLLPEVLEVSIQAGREDLLIHVAISSLDALQVLTAAIVDIDGVRKTNSTFSVATPIPFRVQPLLEHITSDAGWGRSTPAPR